MENIKEDKIFEFQDKKYNIRVGFNEENKLLELTMIDIETNEKKK